MKKHVGYILGLVFLIQNGWGMNEQPQVSRSQSMSSINDKKKQSSKNRFVPKTSAVTDDEDKQESEENPSSTSEISAITSDEPSTEDIKPVSPATPVKTYTDEELLDMFRQHQKNSDVSVRYLLRGVKDGSTAKGIKSLKVYNCVAVTLKDGRKYEINLETGEIQYFEKRRTTLDAIKTALLKSVPNATDVKFFEGKITYYSENKGKLCDVGIANRNEITKAIETTFIKNINDVSIAKDGTIYCFERQENPNNISDAIKVDSIKRESVVTGAKISINDQIHLICDSIWLSVLDTSYDGSLAIEAPRVQTIGTVNCGQFYTRVDSTQGGSFVNWGNLITKYETKIFSEKIRNIGYISHNSEESFVNLPNLEEITEFRRKNSVLLSDDVSNIGKIDVDNIRLANISFSSSGDIKANKIKQSGKGCFVRLGRDIKYEERIADIWNDWINTHYKQNVKFKAEIIDLNTPILSLDIKEPIDSKIRYIKIKDNIDVKLTNPIEYIIDVKLMNPNAKAVGMSSETVPLSKILPDGVNKRDLQFDVSPEQAEDCLKLIYDGKDINAMEKMISLKNAKTNSEAQKLRMVILNNKVSFFAKNGQKIDRIDAFYLWKLFNECMILPLIDNWRKKDEETILKDSLERIILERLKRINTCHQLLMKESQNKIEGDEGYQKNSPEKAKNLSQQLQLCRMQDLQQNGRKTRNLKILLSYYLVDYLNCRDEKIEHDNIIDFWIKMVIREKLKNLRSLPVEEIINQISDTAWSVLFFGKYINRVNSKIRP